MPKKAIVTGAAGFIGSHLVDRLIAEGFSVTGIDDLSSGKLDNLPTGCDFRQMDIRDPILREVIVEINPDLFFHLAAQISVTVSAREPQLDADVNIGGSLNIFEGLRATHGKDVKLVYITSGGTVYGDPGVIPVDESFGVHPLSPYGASKLAVETYLPVYERLCGLNYAILRLANVYGPRQDPHGEAGVVAIFTMAMLEEGSLNIFGDGEDERDYVFVDDVVNAIFKASQSVHTGPFNVGTGINTSTNQMFEILARYCGYTKLPVHAPPRPGDISRISLDPTKAADELDWSAEVLLTDGLKTTVDWFEAVED